MPFPGSFCLGHNLVFSAQVSFLFCILRVRGCIRGRALFFEIAGGSAVGRLRPYSISIGMDRRRAGWPAASLLPRDRPWRDCAGSFAGWRRAPAGSRAGGRGTSSLFMFILFSFLFDFLICPLLLALAVFFCKIFGWPAVFPWT